MRRISYSHLAFAVLIAGLLASTTAFGASIVCPGNTPNPNAANIALRVFNDCPTATVTDFNSYPGQIVITNAGDDCFGGLNLHTWSFSTDGGASKAQFENCSYYHFCADVGLDGDGSGEGGLRLAPWWSPDADGKFMLNVTTGEIACFGGRLPFYSFTVNFGITYVRGAFYHLDVVYNPHSLSSVDPATITYMVKIGPNTYSSGPLPFDSGNLTEGPTYGLWGELTPAYAGGYFQQAGGNGVAQTLACTWMNICYENLGSPVPAEKSTWGKLKTLYR
ncbi:MAG TPA: hypothetical protein VI792_00110 [Candidatus Eisenbacteria bacterium]